MSDDELLTRWRSWIDPDAKPEGWDKNLWDEFYGLQHRRQMWNGYRDALEASPEDAKNSARYLTQWVFRNHVETQALAIRRLANRSANPDTVSLGRLLDAIAAHPDILGIDAAEARKDADSLTESAVKAVRFANKVVAHLDRDHLAASRDVTLADLNAAVDVAGQVWGRWYRAVTGRGVVLDLPEIGWSNVIRLHRRNPAIENAGFIGAQVVHTLGEPAGRELLEVLKRSPEDQAALIGRLYGRSDGRWLAEALMDIEEDPDDVVRLRLIAELERMFGA